MGRIKAMDDDPTGNGFPGKGMDEKLFLALRQVAAFYDRKKIGATGGLGFRKSTDLSRLLAAMEFMIEDGLFYPGRVRFLDLGCADGRVNVLMSYLTEISVGVEIDDWSLEEYRPLRQELDSLLVELGLPTPKPNIFLFRGDVTDGHLWDRIEKQTAKGWQDFDLFYTYMTLLEEFADLVARKAKVGALFMVYGLEKIQPSFSGLKILYPQEPLGGVLSIYQKTK